ncbi:MAG: hypothetical protein Q9184_004138 [Pyrenodesmia sp. 2 TL-2023]
MFGPPRAPLGRRPRRCSRAGHPDMDPRDYNGPTPRRPTYPGVGGFPPGPSAPYGADRDDSIRTQKVQLIEHYARQRGHNLNQWAHHNHMGPKEFAEALVTDLEDALDYGTPHEGRQLVEQLPEWIELEAMETWEMGDRGFGPRDGGGRAPAGRRMGRLGVQHNGGGFGGQQQPGLAQRQEQARRQRRRDSHEIEDTLQMRAMEGRGRF